MIVLIIAAIALFWWCDMHAMEGWQDSEDGYFHEGKIPDGKHDIDEGEIK